METKRLYLRELRPEDWTELAKVLSDPESMKFYPHPFSEEEVKGWITKNIDRYRKDGHGLWAVILKDKYTSLDEETSIDNGNSEGSGTFVGDCGITIQDIDGELLPEIGFHTLPEYCGQGIATEAARACMDYAFQKLGYLKIYSYTIEENIPSQKVAQKIGMHFHKRYVSDGQTHIVHIADKAPKME